MTWHLWRDMVADVQSLARESGGRVSQVLEGEPFVNGHGRHPLVRLVTRERLAGDPEYVHACRSAAVGEAHAPPAGTARPAGEAVGVDFLFMTDGDAWSPEDVFGRLRWGGQAILLSDHRTAIETAAAAYKHWRGGGGAGRGRSSSLRRY